MRTSCIIPAYNEETTIIRVLNNVKKVKTIDEIIVVDDGSTDKTYERAKKTGVKIIRHNKNRGKGAAIKTGYLHSTGDVILFLDADLYNITPQRIASITQPIRSGKADFVKTSFTRARGRVTELVVKPLFNVILPFIKFNQPLSGQFAVRRDIMGELKIDDKWGVDIQILLQLIKKGVRIKEVDIGELVHKKQPIENLAIMSEQVIKTILSEIGIIANKHRLIIFDFDKTIIKESSIEIIAKDFGFYNKLLKLRERLAKGKIKDYQITFELAKYFKRKTKEDLYISCQKMYLFENVDRVIELLKARQYELAVISSAYYQVIEYFTSRLGIKHIISPVLVEDENGVFTGEVISKGKTDLDCCGMLICKHQAAEELMKKLEVRPEECVAVADGKNDACLFRACGLSLAFKPKIKIGDIRITKMSEILVYAE